MYDTVSTHFAFVLYLNIIPFPHYTNEPRAADLKSLDAAHLQRLPQIGEQDGRPSRQDCGRAAVDQTGVSQESRSGRPGRDSRAEDEVLYDRLSAARAISNYIIYTVKDQYNLKENKTIYEADEEEGVPNEGDEQGQT